MKQFHCIGGRLPVFSVVVAALSVSSACTAYTVLPTLAPREASDLSSASQPPATPIDGWQPIPLHVGFGYGRDCCEIYWTDPANPTAGQLSGGIENPLVRAIDGARLYVHAAMYSLSLGDVRDALVRAHRRGVDVRVVMESDNIDAEAPQRLKEAGIPLLGDRREGLMHDKFMVIDGSEVWTGSMNFTGSGAYLDNNVLLRVRSRQMADDYESEFAEMFTDDHFGPDIGRVTPAPQFDVGAIPMEVYFSPDDHVESVLGGLLQNATARVDFLAYSFTSDALGNALVQLSDSGLEVRGVMDADQTSSNQGSEYKAFRAAGIDVRLDGNPGQMHQKVMIIDAGIVVLGSYNFSASAEKSNDENVVIIHDPALARHYLEEFDRIRAVAHP